MPRGALVLLAAAFLALGQAVAFQPAVERLFLGGQWVDVPKYPGDVGLLKLSYYLADQHVDVSISLAGCGLKAEPYKAPSAGPGVFEAVLKVRADGLGRREGCSVVFKSRYRYKSGALTDGVEWVDYLEVEVPNYPSPQAEAVGSLYLGARGRVLLRVWDSYRYMGVVEVSAAGARLYSPGGYYGDVGNLTAYLDVAPLDYSASLVVTVKARDALGREVAVSRQVPLSVQPRPAPRLEASPQWLPAGGCGRVRISVSYPIPLNGTVYVPDGSAPLAGGRGVVYTTVCAAGGYASVPVTVQLDTGAVDKAELQLPVYPISPFPLNVTVQPGVLTAGDVNRVSIYVTAPGPYVGELSVDGAASLTGTPVRFSGNGTTRVDLLLIPTSGVVTIDVAVSAGGYTARSSVALVASQKAPLEVYVEPREVAAGGSHVVKVVVRPRVNMSYLAVTLYPVSGAVFPEATFRLGPQGGAVELPIQIPADVVGNVAVGYRAAYTLASGVSGEYSGTLYLVALQRPQLYIQTSVVPETPTAGEPFYLAVRLFNAGGVEARDVVVNVTGARVVRPPPPLGAIQPQGSKDAVFTLVADGAGPRNITITAVYRDVLGRSYAARSSVALHVNASAPPAATPPQQSGVSEQTWLVLAALIALGAAVVAVGLWRGRVARPR
ncbi:hypothetical protein [Pyrobaculum neutrophilum]|uniref:CARDB domain-containing protein n=1 Tax=Pyrobaculum neutrophilum (strain DSM 2338 / JCM 9278 / NBRC 100436 / V24Sta) TaxID=444157 RepID=B1YDT2_PYRNV|nr:hypothetical protein [Pyrobaculum neutrophilum]ACB39945.1 conserved hypothetical protein [Pyrobaculum neutrophilum V24Sta]